MNKSKLLSIMPINSKTPAGAAMQSSQLCLDPKSGWVTGAQHIPSPNFNQRPHAEVSLIVIHNISLPPGQFATGMIEALFTNQLPINAHPYFAQLEGLEVSAHFLIERCGSLKQFVSCNDRAWHAGASNYQGRANCNDFSIGIELEGTDVIPYTEAQYSRLKQLTCLLNEHYPIQNRICGHSDIAPGRKTDPGPAFIWSKISE